MKLTLNDLKLYTLQNDYYINGMCSFYNKTKEEFSLFMNKYLLNHPKLWIRAIKKNIKPQDFNNYLSIFNKEDLINFIEEHKVDSQMSFNYYIAIVAFVYGNDFNILYKYAKSKRLDSKKNICYIGLYTDDKLYFDTIFKELRVKEIDKYMQIKNLKDILINGQPVNELQLINACYKYNHFVDFDVNVSRLASTKDFLIYLHYRINISMIMDYNYDYDLTTLNYIIQYDLNSTDRYMNFLLYSYCQLIISKYKNCNELTNKIHSLSLQYALLNKLNNLNIYKSITSDFNKKIYFMDISEQNIHLDAYYVYVYKIVYNDNSYKTIISAYCKNFTPVIKVIYNSTIRECNSINENYKNGEMDGLINVGILNYLEMEQINNADFKLIKEVR